VIASSASHRLTVSWSAEDGFTGTLVVHRLPPIWARDTGDNQGHHHHPENAIMSRFPISLFYVMMMVVDPPTHTSVFPRYGSEDWYPTSGPC
jgi:hypothetical protein